MFKTILALNPIRLVSNALPGILAAVFGRSRNAMLRGDRKAVALANWPEGRWPTLYQDIPADIRRPVVWDGRILGGMAVPWLAWRHLTDDVIKAAAYNAGMNALRVSFFLILGLTAWALWLPLTAGINFRQYPAWANEAGAWNAIAGHYVLVVLDVVFGFISMALALGGSVILGFCAAWIFGFWRSLKAWWNTVSEPLRTPTRDSMVGFKSKTVTRQLEYEAYCRQVNEATGRLADQPLIKVGTATGLLRSRGDMNSPLRGQMVCLDGESIHKHVIALGMTGTGKTRLVIEPMFKAYLGANWGNGHKAGAYVTDGKGALWTDLMPSVAHRDDVRVIGIGRDQYGVNLLKGMTPLEVSTVFKSVTGQISASSGGAPSGDDIWPESASLLMMHTAMLALVLETDEQTQADAAWQTLRPYSLLGLSRLASSEALQSDAIDRITELGAEAGNNGEVITDELSQALDAATWFKESWLPRASETKSSVVMNIEQVLGKLFGSPALSRRFFTGMIEEGREIDVDHALYGGILMSAVGETEFGMAGKVVSCWIKSRLFIAARRRQITDPTAKDRYSCAVVADEFQMLVTQGPDSDTQFWNVGRSTGVFLIAATQSVAALQQVLGSDQTANILNQCSTKIVLRTDEFSTLEYVRRIAGELPRGFEAAPSFYATQGDREVAVPDVNGANPRANWKQSFFPTWPSLPTHSMKSVFQFNKANVVKNSNDGNMSKLNSTVAESVRVADKNDRVAAEGLQWRAKIETDELLLGSGFAFAIVQRAGGARADVIDLEIAA